MRKLKIITIASIMFLTFYPVFELSRCIIKYMIIEDMGLGPIGDYYLELTLIWSFYLAIPFLLSKLINLAYKMGVKENGL